MNNRLLQSLSLLGLLSTSASAQTVIYSDSFTNADDTTILGLSPETNNGVAGATYHESNNFWTQNSPVGIFNNRAQLGADNQASLPIASDGDFVQPEKIGVSVVLNLGTTAPAPVPDDVPVKRGVGVGFYTATGGVATPVGFRGLMITTEGTLILAQEGENASPRAGEIVEITNGIDTSVDHTVAFEIDTTTGDISNILLDGALQADVETTIFDSNINHVGFMVSSQSGGTLAQYDDFTVTNAAVPTVDPFITSITPIDATTYELTEVGAPSSEYNLGTSDVLDFENGSLVENFTQASVDDPGTIGLSGNLIILDENGNATFRFTSEEPTTFFRLQEPVATLF